MTDNDKLIFCIAALRKIAVSYRVRIDRVDTPAYVFADQALAYIGQDVEKIMPENDKLPDMFLAFHEWRKATEA